MFNDEQTIYIYALRHALEKRGGAEFIVTEQIRGRIGEFDTWNLKEMQEDIENAFQNGEIKVKWSREAFDGLLLEIVAERKKREDAK